LETITVHEGNTTVTNPHCGSGDPHACGRGNLKGSLPSEIGKLTNLKSLRFDCNGLNGSVSFLGKLTNLVEAHLFNQNWGGGGFKGPLPQDLAKLTDLQFIDVRQNTMSGTLPALNFSHIASFGDPPMPCRDPDHPVDGGSCKLGGGFACPLPTGAREFCCAQCSGSSVSHSATTLP
jgi:hypothetical protein